MIYLLLWPIVGILIFVGYAFIVDGIRSTFEDVFTLDFFKCILMGAGVGPIMGYAIYLAEMDHRAQPLSLKGEVFEELRNLGILTKRPHGWFLGKTHKIFV